MKNLYAGLAATNIKNNKQFYFPYLLTGIIMAVMFYTMTAILDNEGINSIPGTGTLKSILSFGTFVIGLFVFIFLFYTNSFIMKRRTKELGIYNILGMEKRHIAKILFIENTVAALVSIVGGLLLGIAFNKFLMMVLYKILSFESPIYFTVCWKGVRDTVILFGIIYLVILIRNLMQIKLANPMELLHSSSAGEKEPKAKVLLAILGIICIGMGYAFSIFVKSPVIALLLFFVAVVLVIIGTYCLFTAGSITFLKMLRKRKGFYYQPKHFSAVSGMIYRMKRNAVGLANICILATMVLVMVSTTVCMFAGADDELATRFPWEITVKASYDEETDHSELMKIVEDMINDNNRTITAESANPQFDFVTPLDGADIKGSRIVNDLNLNELAIFVVMTQDVYEALYGGEEGSELPKIEKGEVALVGSEYSYKDINIYGNSYGVKKNIVDLSVGDNIMAQAVNGYYLLLVPDSDTYEEIYQLQKTVLGTDASQKQYMINMEISGTAEEKEACENALLAKISEMRSNGELPQYESVYVEGRESNRASFFAINGGFFFLGIFLGIMFLMVTVLIIFYKQISEGYEDKERYIIMEKVGMSAIEVKRSINSQIRTVFLLPIITAGFHVLAAFPMIKKMLAMLSLTNTALFVGCLVGTILVFTLIYVLVFYITSRSYYKIVGNQV